MSILKNIIKTLLSSFGILFIIMFVLVYSSFRTSVQTFISDNLFGKLDINEIKILPKNARADNIFTPGSSQGASISAGQVKSVRAMKDFTETFSITQLEYSVTIKGEMMGRSMETFVPVFGADPAYFKGKDKFWNRFQNRMPVPVYAPNFTLKYINNFLNIKGLPQMKADQFRNFPLEFKIETTPQTHPDRKKYKLDAVFLSFTEAFPFTGAIVPNSFIADFCALHAKDTGKYKKGYVYVMMFARVKDTKELPRIVAELEKLGLKIESQKDIADKTNRALKIFDYFSASILSVFFLITVISIFNSYLTIVYNRSNKISLRRILGVSKLRIITGFLFESAAVGLLYGIIGYYLANKLLFEIAKNIKELIPVLADVAINPVTTEVMFMALGLSMAVSMVSALLPAIFASNINLFKAVRK